MTATVTEEWVTLDELMGEFDEREHIFCIGSKCNDINKLKPGDMVTGFCGAVEQWQGHEDNWWVPGQPGICVECEYLAENGCRRCGE